jgi:hypothetical protein
MGRLGWDAGRGLVVLGLAMAAACGRPGSSPATVVPPAGYSMSGDGDGVTPDGAATPAHCSLETDCSPPASPCARAVCLPNGACGEAPTPAGAPASLQVAGDCLVDLCDGAGVVMSAPDDADVPDDGNGCTEDSCADGQPTFTNRPAGTSCSEGADGALCDGHGQCMGAEPSPLVL